MIDQPTYLGIDFNTHAIDLVLITEDQEQTAWLNIPLTGQTSLIRLRNISARFPRSSWFDDHNVTIAGIEKPMGRNQPGTTSSLSRVAGATISRIPNRIEVWEFPPGEWRRQNGVAGNAPKPVVAAEAISLGANPEWNNQDAYDAYMIARATLLINEKAII